MKYADRFFKFPIRVYDRYSASIAEKEEELQQGPVEGAWRPGVARIELEEIKTWNDFFDSEQGVEGVDEEGFLFTLIFTKTQGPFICTWSLSKFEEKMNDFAEKYEGWLMKKREEFVQKGLMPPSETIEIQVQ